MADADRLGIEGPLGGDVPLEKDWHVSYQRVPELGIVYMVHSCIEYVFATEEQIARAQELALAEEFGEGGDDAPGPSGP